MGRDHCQAPLRCGALRGAIANFYGGAQREVRSRRRGNPIDGAGDEFAFAERGGMSDDERIMDRVERGDI